MAKRWEDDKAYYKIMNLQNPGDPIQINFNALPTFNFVDGATALMPKAVANALNNAIETIMDINGKENDPTSRKMIDRPRYAAMIDQAKTDEFEKNGNKVDIASDLEKSLEAQKADKKKRDK